MRRLRHKAGVYSRAALYCGILSWILIVRLVTSSGAEILLDIAALAFLETFMLACVSLTQRTRNVLQALEGLLSCADTDMVRDMGIRTHLLALVADGERYFEDHLP